MASNIAALEPLNLGKGKSEIVVNLDAGQTPSANKAYFGTGGFIAPLVSQVAEVSPGAMVHQSKKYRDESMAVYKNALDVLNRTSDAGNAALQSSARAATSEGEAKSGANSSKGNALLCNAYLSEAVSVFNRTLAVSQRAEMLEHNITEMTNRTQENSRIAARSAQIASLYQNDTKEGNISMLIQRIEMLEERLSLLEAKEAMRK